MLRIALTAAMLLAFAAAGHAGETRGPVTLYKTPQCGCCEEYAQYLRDNGFVVTVKPEHNMPMVKRMAGVPSQIEGCHTAMIDGYVVEGHVPIATLQRLLAERPDVRGISLPGMPLGSPGMNGRKEEPFKIYQFKGSQVGVYAVE